MFVDTAMVLIIEYLDKFNGFQQGLSGIVHQPRPKAEELGKHRTLKNLKPTTEKEEKESFTPPNARLRNMAVKVHFENWFERDDTNIFF